MSIKKNLIRVGIISGAIVSLGALIVGGAYGYRYYAVTLPKSQVRVTINYDLEKCGLALPLAVVVKNDSRKKVHTISFRVSARYPGTSNNLLKHNKLSIYRTMPSQDSLRECSAIPQFKQSNPLERFEKLEWFADNYFISFTD